MSGREPTPHDASYSAISSFHECAEKYAHNYLWGTPREKVSLANLYGSAVHDALERGEEAGWWKDASTADEYIAAFNVSFYERIANVPATLEVKVGGRATQKWPDGDTAERLVAERAPQQLGRAIALRQSWAEEGWEPMGAEVRAMGEVDGKVLLGYIDLLMVTADGEIVVVDWKTGGSTLGIKETQALTYCWMLSEAGVIARRAEFAWLAGATPETQRIQFAFTDAQVELVPNMVRAFSAGIAAGIYPPTPSNLCDWCSFKSSCSYYGQDVGSGVSLTGEGEAPSQEPPAALTRGVGG